MASESPLCFKNLKEAPIPPRRVLVQTIDYVSGWHNCLEFSQPFSCLDDRGCKHENDALLLSILYCVRKPE